MSKPVEYMLRSLLCAAPLILGLGCGGSQPAETLDPGEVSHEPLDDSTAADQGGGMQVEGLLGTVSQDEIDRVFDRNMQGLMRCYQEALEDLEEIEGRLELALQVASDGSVMSAHVKEADLGSLETETCMVSKAERFTFRRAGGGVADIAYPLTLEAPYDPPDPTIWKGPAVMEVVREHADELDGCLGGRSGAHITLYIGKGGVVLSSGAAAEEPDLYDAALCVARAARGWTFSDPGSKLVKVSLDL